MKSLMDFEAVKKALEQVVAESDVNNGTNGMEFFCHYWSHENQYEERRQKLMEEMARSVFLNKPEEIIRIRELVEALEKPKIIIEFRLLLPIPLVKGTKTIVDDEGTHTISAENVRSIFIHEDSLKSQLGEFEETDDVAKDVMGRDTKIIKLKINKGLLDVKEAIVDSRDDNRPENQRRIIRPKMVYLVAVSFHALQVVGRMKQNEKRAARRRFGFDKL